MVKFDWEKNPEACDKLKAMWTAGNSGSEIARVLGNGLTRSAVMGKVHRMGLKTHPIGLHLAVSTKKASVPLPKPKPGPIEHFPPAIFPETWAEKDQCKHISGDPLAPNWNMCGNVVKPGSNYCPYHHGIVFVPNVKVAR